MVIACLLAGCVTDGRDEVVQAGPIDKPFFAVSEVFTPSGHMGDGQTRGFVQMFVNENCKARPLKARADGSGATFGSCYNFAYEAGPINWAGAYWVYPSNNWGTEKGRLFKPWSLSGLEVYQRYNTVQFDAAVNQNSLELTFAALSVDQRQYRLNGTVSISGATTQAIPTQLYFQAPETRAYLKVVDGAHTAVLVPGWVLELKAEDGTFQPVAEATLGSEQVPFVITRGVETDVGFDVLHGTETLRFSLRTPPVSIDFFAGAIKEDRLVGLLCSDRSKPCPHKDAVTSSELQKKQRVTRTWQTYNLALTLRPPCVANWQGEKPSSERDEAGERTGKILCPAGTVTEDGLIATCGQTASGTVTREGAVLCCVTGAPTRTAETEPWTCNGDSRPGEWAHWDGITESLIGAFGWATNYQTFQKAEEAAQRAMGVEPAPPDEGGVATVDPTLLPQTEVFIDNIVWQFLPTR